MLFMIFYLIIRMFISLKIYDLFPVKFTIFFKNNFSFFTSFYMNKIDFLLVSFSSLRNIINFIF